ncbi:YafY family protein [Rhodococcus sp. HNM0569]|uniref:WYL domain-containing protein n=1 Tax=Rhodococcus sp. HNM0569 TaxID=2716340 RepID=UPI00146F6827|nr:YafY family transcriptional regulator [Rhodococcus sp. HNM0569]
MRSTRLLQLMLRLEGGRGATAQRLATELEVSVRTVYRDVAALASAGVPVVTDSGPGGGIRLLDGWQSRLSGLTIDETSALMLLGVPSVASELGLGADDVRGKLLGALPASLSARARTWGERVLVDAPGWFRGADESSALLPAVARAVVTDTRLRLEYVSKERRSRRTVDPLGLVVKAGVWYLVAAHRDRILTYRVSRIASVDEVAGEVHRPDGFVLSQWWADTARRFDRALLRYDCRVRLSPYAWRRLPDVVGVEAAAVAPEPADADGWVAVDLRLEAEDVAASQLAALPGDVEVLAPEALRRRVRDAAEAAVALNR